MSDAVETFQVDEKPTKTEEAKPPTLEDLQSKGWSEKEIESAKKHGMLEKHDPPKVKEEKPTDEKKPVDEKKPADEKPEETKKVDVPDPKRDVGPLADIQFTDDQVQMLKKVFPYIEEPDEKNGYKGKMHPAVALFVRSKHERRERQKIQQAFEQERQSRLHLEEKVKQLESGTPQPEVDEDGNVVDPEDKPLTLKQLRQIQQDEAKRIEEKQKQDAEISRKRTEAQTAQEEYARSLYPDFDDTVALTIDMGKIISGNKLEEQVPERWKQMKILNLFRQLQAAAYNAEKIDLDDYHAAMLAYEIGQLHPKYGHKADVVPAKTNGAAAEPDGKTLDPNKANGGHLTPEQMKRIEETQRRTSSASITGGGGSRTISAEDVDASRLNQMNYQDRQRFRQKYPDRYAKIMRG